MYIHTLNNGLCPSPCDGSGCVTAIKFFSVGLYTLHDNLCRLMSLWAGRCAIYTALVMRCKDVFAKVKQLLLHISHTGTKGSVPAE